MSHTRPEGSPPDIRDFKKWDLRFLGLAHTVAKWSKDPSTQVGCVIVDEARRIISTGYNGFPRGVLDLEELYNNRDEKYPRVVHAEANAILFAKQPLQGATLYCTFTPCPTCTGYIIQSGVKRVVVVENARDSAYAKPFEISRQMLSQASVALHVYPAEPQPGNNQQQP